MKKILMALAFSGLTLACATTALATSYTFVDNYVDEIGSNGNPLKGPDSIGLGGDPNGVNFDIAKTVVTIEDSQITFNLYSLKENGYFSKGIGIYGLGDLFLDTDATAGWDYAITLNSKTSTSGSGTTTLFQVVSSITNGNVRTNQAALYTPTNSEQSLATGSWSLNGAKEPDPLYNYLNITINLADVWDGTSPLGFHWTMACGNDVVQDVINPVPEPATLLLLGTGLAGLAGFSRRRVKK